MFKNAKVGDKVWDIRRGWGEIIEIEQMQIHPISVKFPNTRFSTYNIDGKSTSGDINPSIYWDEFKVIPPKKPLPDLPVDTKVLVWDDKDTYKIKAHFHSFDEDGNIITYSSGLSSFTGEDKVKSLWDNWELYEE